MIPDCANAGKDPAASRIERMDRVSMERSWIKKRKEEEEKIFMDWSSRE